MNSRKHNIWERILFRVAQLSAYVLLPLLLSVSLYDLIGRQFFNTGSTRLQELQWHFFFAATIFGIGYTYLQEGHVRIDIFRARFSDRVRGGVEILGIIFALFPFSVLLIWTGAEQAYGSFIAGEKSLAALGLPHRWIIRSTVPIGGLLLLIAGGLRLRSQIVSFINATPRS